MAPKFEKHGGPREPRDVLGSEDGQGVILRNICLEKHLQIDRYMP